MLSRGIRCLAALSVILACCTQAAVAAPVRVVVSFSILEDIVRRIGGGEVAVTSLIGPDSDAHVFEPNPDQARLLAKAQLFVVNGLGFEGWLTRLTRSAQFVGVVVTAADGVAPAGQSQLRLPANADTGLSGSLLMCDIPATS